MISTLHYISLRRSLVELLLLKINLVFRMARYSLDRPCHLLDYVIFIVGHRGLLPWHRRYYVLGSSGPPSVHPLHCIFHFLHNFTAIYGEQKCLSRVGISSIILGFCNMSHFSEAFPSTLYRGIPIDALPSNSLYYSLQNE